MKKVIKLTENDFRNLVNRIINEQPIGDYTKDFNDASNSKYGQSVGPGKFTGGNITPSVTMDGSLFKNGIDLIDKNSEAFKSGVEAIKKSIQTNPGQPVIVKGGASAVGSKEGYDNQALASRRAQNFVKAVQPLFPNVKFNLNNPEVGVATIKNSPEANKEQFVKLFFAGSIRPGKQMAAVDNTQQVYRPRKGVPKEETKVEDNITYVKVCYWVPLKNVSTFMGSVKPTGAKKI
jgi:hypothetical protein